MSQNTNQELHKPTKYHKQPRKRIYQLQIYSACIIFQV